MDGAVVAVDGGKEEEGDDVTLMWRSTFTWLVTRRDDMTFHLSHHHLTDAA